MKYQVRRAIHSDLPAVFELRRAAETWLAAAGIEQWKNTETGRAALRRFCANRTLRVVTDPAGHIVACFALDGPDQDFWTPEEAAEPASYLYKLIVSRAHKGRGLGDAILNHACRTAAADGAKWVRMDCWRTNRRLQQYYLDRGFEHIDTRVAPDRNSGWLAQRPTWFMTSTNVELIEDTHVHRYDPDGVAAIWEEAADLVADLKAAGPQTDDWDAALDQAGRVLERRAIEARQSQGSYYRTLTG